MKNFLFERFRFTDVKQKFQFIPFSAKNIQRTIVSCHGTLVRSQVKFRLKFAGWFRCHYSIMHSFYPNEQMNVLWMLNHNSLVLTNRIICVGCTNIELVFRYVSSVEQYVLTRYTYICITHEFIENDRGISSLEAEPQTHRNRICSVTCKLIEHHK